MNLRGRKVRMWIFKYLACLIGNHSVIDIIWKGSAYQYCLWCGKVKISNAATETVLVDTRRH